MQIKLRVNKMIQVWMVSWKAWISVADSWADKNCQEKLMSTSEHDRSRNEGI